jgi:hypothetical protein
MKAGAARWASAQRRSCCPGHEVPVMAFRTYRRDTPEMARRGWLTYGFTTSAQPEHSLARLWILTCATNTPKASGRCRCGKPERQRSGGARQRPRKRASRPNSDCSPQRSTHRTLGAWQLSRWCTVAGSARGRGSCSLRYCGKPAMRSSPWTAGRGWVGEL